MGKVRTDSFNYTAALRDVCFDVCAKVGEFRAIDVRAIAFSFGLARNRTSRYGEWAHVTPLRFEGGAAVVRRFSTVRRVKDGVAFVEKKEYFCAIPTVLANDGTTRALYIFSVMAPRFYDLSVTEKIDTIMHELYHISPKFDGYVRRFSGRDWMHGSSKEAYDARAHKLALEWLATEPDPALYNFLSLDRKGLIERYGAISGWRYPSVKPRAITEEEARRLAPELFNAK